MHKPFLEADILEIIDKHLRVRYHYDKSAASQDSIQTEGFTLTPDALNSLPADWLASLHLATIDGDFELMLTLIAQIREQHEPLANAVADLANNFQLEKLLSLTQSRPV